MGTLKQSLLVNYSCTKDSCVTRVKRRGFPAGRQEKAAEFNPRDGQNLEGRRYHIKSGAEGKLGERKTQYQLHQESTQGGGILPDRKFYNLGLLKLPPLRSTLSQAPP